MRMIPAAALIIAYACGATSALRPLIIFGRPGAGKTTIADALIAAAPPASCYGVDLDDCVPQWMRDNFAEGIYPTESQRAAFAAAAADRVDAAAAAEAAVARCIVSFSFVNDDLRDFFRRRYPDADWVLVDTTETDAASRIAAREGHFYKGATPAAGGRGDEWRFAPVRFGHLRLDGARPVAELVRDVLPLVVSRR